MAETTPTIHIEPDQDKIIVSWTNDRTVVEISNLAVSIADVIGTATVSVNRAGIGIALVDALATQHTGMTIISTYPEDVHPHVTYAPSPFPVVGSTQSPLDKFIIKGSTHTQRVQAHLEALREQSADTAAKIEAKRLFDAEQRAAQR